MDTKEIKGRKEEMILTGHTHTHTCATIYNIIKRCLDT
jgi:hypothetical protein